MSDFAAVVERITNRTIAKVFSPAPIVDLPQTQADGTLLCRVADFIPDTAIDIGIRCCVEWYENDEAAALWLDGAGT